MSTVIKGLDNDFIATLLANKRTRGGYSNKVVEFDNSKEKGVNVREVWTELKDKPAATLYQGFNNALRNAKVENITCQRDGNNIYLLNMELIKAAE